MTCSTVKKLEEPLEEPEREKHRRKKPPAASNEMNQDEIDSEKVQAVSVYPRKNPIESLEWRALENRLNPSVKEPPKLELKELLDHLEYDFLQEDDQLPVVISSFLSMDEKAKLIKVGQPNITMEEYIRLEEEKACRRGKVYNWKTATYGNIWYNEDVHDLRFFEIEFPAIVFNDELSFEKNFRVNPRLTSTLGFLMQVLIRRILGNGYCVHSQLIGKDSVSGLLVYELPSSLRKKYRLSLKNDMPPRDK
uniref:Reverse transcriptase domain-containing protein n=1 Tax=Tanacetum cinerariifolium TaxID=118510 RepID=A0A699GS20_TANCI|nr:hypothetical protein [Tanacetum cinerariifolium]